MKTVSSAKMRDLERQAVEEFGISTPTLMEKAGQGAAEIVLSRFPKAQNILIVCGKGNNGGDGFVIARCLDEAGKQVTVVLLCNPEELKGDAKHNFQRLGSLDCFVGHWPPRNDEKTNVIVDAILGTGLKAEVTGKYKEAIDWINQSGMPVIAVDIPSGLDADSGEIHGVCVKADLTVTMGFAKDGMLKGEGPKVCGEICVIDIGLPEELVVEKGEGRC